MRFRTALIWNGISQFGQSGINLLSTIILAHILTPTDFGIIGIVTIFIAFSQMMVDSEMGGALLRKNHVTIVDYSTLFYYNLIVSLVLYGLLYVAAPFIANFYELPILTEVIRLISLTIIIHAFRVVQRIMIFRDLKFKDYAVINIVSGIISLGVAVWLAKKGYSFWALVWQQITLASINVILMECYNRFIPKLTFSKESFRYQFSFGINLLGSDTVRTIANNISTNIIAKISSMNLTGNYSQVSKLTNFCQSTLGSLMDQSIFPMLAKYERVAAVRSTYYRILICLSLTLICVSTVFIIFAKPIIIGVLGHQWLGGVVIFQILSLAILPASIQVLCRNILKVLGTTRHILYIEIIKSSIIISLLIAASFFNTDLVIWALVTAQTISCIIWLLCTHKELNRALHNNGGRVNV